MVIIECNEGKQHYIYKIITVLLIASLLKYII